MLLGFSGSSIMVKLVNESPLFAMDQEFMNLFYNKKPTDCIIYSEDGIPFQIHREILSQTELMQNLLTSAKESCCQNLEIICPCSKSELEYVVKFFYEGQLKCDSSFDLSNILKILTKVFGFPEKFLGEWQEEFEITENENDITNTKISSPDFGFAPTEILSDNPNSENDTTNTKIFDVDFKTDIKNEVDLDSIEESFSNPIIITLKPKKFKSNDVKQRSQGVKPFKCEICSAGFMKKINLIRHIKVIHKEVKPSNSGIYDANFTFKRTVKKHKATVHEGQKRNIHFDKRIEICDSLPTAPTKISSENAAVNLIKQNSKERMTNPRRRSCTYCDQTFSNRGNLNRHIRTNHESKKYPCTECSNCRKEAGGARVE